MTNAEHGADCGEKDHRRCSRCDPGLLDELKCQAKGIQEQAKYNEEHGKELDDARDAFKTARALYNAARSAAAPLVADARRQLEELEERVRCQLDRGDAECIDTAFGRVVERLNRCGHERGCCCDGDCDYDDDIRDCDPDDVPGRLAVIEHRTEEAADCFWSLIGEHTVPPKPDPSAATPAATTPAATTPAATAPAAAATTTPASAPATAAPAAGTSAPASPPDPALPARVKALQDEIAEITKAAGDGSWEPAKLYAAVLVARRHLKNVWRGFADVNEYMECLCQALTCMIKGHAAIGELIRQQAVNQCYRDTWKTACEHLAQNTVEEVLAEYLRVCAESCDEDKPDRGRDKHRDREMGTATTIGTRTGTVTGTTTGITTATAAGMTTATTTGTAAGTTTGTTTAAATATTTATETTTETTTGTGTGTTTIAPEGGHAGTATPAVAIARRRA